MFDVCDACDVCDISDVWWLLVAWDFFFCTKLHFGTVAVRERRDPRLWLSMDLTRKSLATGPQWEHHSHPLWRSGSQSDNGIVTALREKLFGHFWTIFWSYESPPIFAASHCESRCWLVSRFPQGILKAMTGGDYEARAFEHIAFAVSGAPLKMTWLAYEIKLTYDNSQKTFIPLGFVAALSWRALAVVFAFRRALVDLTCGA